MCFLRLALVPMLLLAACGDADGGAATDATTSTSPSTTAAAPSPTTAAAPTTPTTTAAAPTTTNSTAPTTTAAAPTTTAVAPTTTAAAPTTAAAADDADCRVLDDPIEGQPSGWTVVNDGVMGGRSEGQVAVVEDALVFDGEIVTAGGGFSSIRTELDLGALEDASRIVVRARTDGRSYVLTADDAAAERDRRTSFQAPIPFTPEPGLQIVEVLLDDLAPVVFGQPVDDAPFVRELAVEVGIQLSDGVDGPFRLELEALLVCAD